MKKKFIIYKQATKTKKAVLDENMYKVYLSNPEIKEVQEFDSEILMEKAYAEQMNINQNKKYLLG